MDEIKQKLGLALKEERERQNISLEDISVKLKISEEYLTAVETAQISELPSELYFNLFAKSYCEAIGIDFSRTVEAIEIEIEEEKETPSKKKTSTSANSTDEEGEEYDTESYDGSSLQESKNWMIYAAALIVVIAFVVMYSFMNKNSAEKEARESEKQKQSEQFKAKFSGYKWPSDEYKKASPLSLSLTATEESWATVLADGDTAIFRNLIPGRIYYVEAKYRLRVSIGIPKNVKIMLNKREVNLVNPESRRISKVHINQLNLEDFLNPKPVEVSNKIEAPQESKPVTSPPAKETSSEVDSL